MPEQAVEFVIRLEQLEPMACRFLLNFAKDNELQVRDGRVAERTKLAELQRVTSEP